jgi:hypothetical protein
MVVANCYKDYESGDSGCEPPKNLLFLFSFSFVAFIDEFLDLPCYGELK